MIQLIKIGTKQGQCPLAACPGVRKYKRIYKLFTPEYSSHPSITGPPAKKIGQEIPPNDPMHILTPKCWKYFIKTPDTAFYAGLLMSAKGYGEPSLVLFAARK